jgi:curved DNA-binding protein CbpA
MTDYFAFLRQPHQPLLDDRAIEQAFHQRARLLHPDAAGANERDEFAQLNTAFNVLRDPRLRLRHLLELEGVMPAKELLAPELVELFSRAAEISHQAKAEIAKERSSDSAIARSVARLKRSQIGTELVSVLQELEANERCARSDLEDLNEIWGKERPAAVAKAMQLQQRFTILQRWIDTLRELQFQLEN